MAKFCGASCPHGGHQDEERERRMAARQAEQERLHAADQRPGVRRPGGASSGRANFRLGSAKPESWPASCTT
jgi:hypothetical protein